MHRRLTGAVVLGLLLASCRDEDIADEPVLPDNVDASVAQCGVVEGSAGATSDDLAPGASAAVRVAGAGDVAAVDDCSIEDVVDLSD